MAAPKHNLQSSQAFKSDLIEQEVKEKTSLPTNTWSHFDKWQRTIRTKCQATQECLVQGDMQHGW